MQFTLPEFHFININRWNGRCMLIKVNLVLGTYDMYIKGILMEAIGMDLLFSNNLMKWPMKWDNVIVPMRDLSFGLMKLIRTFTQTNVTLCMIRLPVRSKRIQRYNGYQICTSWSWQDSWRNCTLKQIDCRLSQSLFEKYEDLFNITLETSTSTRTNTISWQIPPGSKLVREELRVETASMYNLEYCKGSTDQNGLHSIYHTRKGWPS